MIFCHPKLCHFCSLVWCRCMNIIHVYLHLSIYKKNNNQIFVYSAIFLFKICPQINIRISPNFWKLLQNVCKYLSALNSVFIHVMPNVIQKHFRKKCLTVDWSLDQRNSKWRNMEHWNLLIIRKLTNICNYCVTLLYKYLQLINYSVCIHFIISI